jgi:adenylate kinase
MRLIFLGPPGSGKGTQAEILAKQLQIPHISTGDILRQAIAHKTGLGFQSEIHVNAGELVPDILVMAIMRERFGMADMQQGWILDGFPRTLSQAEALDELLQIMNQPYGHAIYFNVATEVVVERMLQQGRLDDNATTIRRRLEVYEAEIAPLIDYYRRRRFLKSIDGNLSVEKVNLALQEFLGLPVGA